MKLYLIEINETALERIPKEDRVVLAEYPATEKAISAKYAMIASIRKHASIDYKKQMEAIDKLEDEIELIKNRTTDEQF